MNFETILYEKNNKIATIYLNRPASYNAFTQKMNQEITYAFKLATKDEEIRCIVLTGSGKAFCSGQDLAEVDEQTNHATFLRERYHPMLQTIKQTPKPVIAAVNGIAAGAGMGLALAADFRLMKENAKFVSAFMNIGLVPDSGFLYILPRLIGYAKALEVTVLGKPIVAEEAKALGLATEVYSEQDFLEQVENFAFQMVALPTKAFSLLKRYMLDSMHTDYGTFLEQEAYAQRIAGMSTDHLEGLQAFVEKRNPNFIGK
ncbi:enoyl-CoA hydratase/isomerase family protein [Ornithinibacillus bavariensis]|uniref:2-(1,2-epoxy-1,2-dihydrophenyl)acetyl-CoA isomerase n=1 Tax=Ornithinibacillus bavariensis TaxID=545502 RepID=A0A920C5G2_9BACI|nr:enoyl-CoA hydratase-related protein [Ornithinibacillus bavariensis]GIO26695.1 2-(1,2-epoxy-1,2-dihydrophenyl)acetyl-CoA isomerase [Ornithinibacillus bavariensis]HAM80856.1 2-(1,2-epoxy-1,2-dihydrophenyl)acetyl-CoA isomerase [Ornithinibacillus sp.]